MIASTLWAVRCYFCCDKKSKTDTAPDVGSTLRGIGMRYQIRHALVQYGADTILQAVNFEVHDNATIAIV